MGLFGLFGRDKGLDVHELAARLGLREADVEAIEPNYREFTINKRSGGTRRILAPEERLKRDQRLILRRVLGRLRAHPAAHGFERGRSIVTNALPHVGRPLVLRMDVKDFFDSTRAKRVEKYFRKIGWNKKAAKMLTRLCTYQGGLPQGAPTSPRLSNLVNYNFDAALTAMAVKIGANYTRYADDITFSFERDDPRGLRIATRFTRIMARKLGYEMHRRKKMSIRRGHDRQLVTGLVVNEAVNLPRETRRWLRAVEHRLASGKSATIDERQLQGWRALRSMIERQAAHGARG